MSHYARVVKLWYFEVSRNLQVTFRSFSRGKRLKSKFFNPAAVVITSVVLFHV